MALFLLYIYKEVHMVDTVDIRLIKKIIKHSTDINEIYDYECLLADLKEFRRRR